MYRKSLKTLLVGLYLTGLLISSSLFSSVLYAQTNETPQVGTEPAPLEVIHDTEAPKKVPVEKSLDSQINDLTSDAQDSAAELESRASELNKSYDGLYKGAGKSSPTPNLFDHETAIKQMALQMNHNLKPAEIKKMKIHEAIGMALMPLQKLTEEQILSQLLENTKDTPTHAYFLKFPKLTKFAVRMIKDPHALVEASKVLENRDRLLHFGAVMIMTILFGFFLKKLVSTSSENLFRIVLFFFLRVLIMMSLRFSIIIYFFGDELSPMFTIFVKTFFN